MRCGVYGHTKDVGLIDFNLTGGAAGADLQADCLRLLHHRLGAADGPQGAVKGGEEAPDLSFDHHWNVSTKVGQSQEIGLATLVEHALERAARYVTLTVTHCSHITYTWMCCGWNFRTATKLLFVRVEIARYANEKLNGRSESISRTMQALAGNTHATIDNWTQRLLLRFPVLPWAVLLLSVVLALWAWHFTSAKAEEAERLRFERRASEIQDVVHERLALYENSLRGAAGLFAASDEVSREEWRRYVEALELETRYPGVQGLGFSVRIAAGLKDAHVAAVRAEGFQDYSIKPSGPRPEYHSIVYLEPFSGRNLRAFGYDMFSEPVRREAMERARDTGLPAVSGKVKLVQETSEDVQAGFLMYLPVYRRGMPVDSAAERREALHGFVYSPFRTNDLITKALGERVTSIGLRIYDGKRTTPAELLYTSGQSAVLDGTSAMRSTRVISFGGRPWTLEVAAPVASQREPAAVLASGLAIATLLFAIAQVYAKSGSRAAAMAEAMTHELRESRESFRAVTETASDAIVSADSSGRITYFNKAAERTFGYTAGEAMGQPVTLIMPERFAEAHRQGLARYIETGEARLIGKTVEVVARARQGTELPVEVSLATWRTAKGVFFTAILRDITQRKQAADALREMNASLEKRVTERTKELHEALEKTDRSERHYRMLFDHNPQPMWVYDRETLRFLAINRAAVESYGYSHEEFLAMTIADIRPPEDWEAFGRLVRNLPPSRLFSGRHTHRKKDGEHIIVEITSDAIDFAGKSARLVLAADVTDKVQAEQQILRLNTELEQRVKDRTAQLQAANAELEAFSYSVSHDLRAPLRHIGGFASMLQGEASASLSEAGARYVAIIIESVRHMGSLIDDLLAFAKMGRTELQHARVDMNELVREAQAILEGAMAGRDIEWRIEPLPVVRGDRALLKQVWTNLLSNAVKYTRYREKARIEVGSRTLIGGFEFRVRDNGAGFDMAYAQKLFGVFQRLHRADEFEGTGVGLASVRRIIARHGGTTRAEGKVDEGASVYFTLPLSERTNDA